MVLCQSTISSSVLWIFPTACSSMWMAHANSALAHFSWPTIDASTCQISVTGMGQMATVSSACSHLCSVAKIADSTSDFVRLTRVTTVVPAKMAITWRLTKWTARRIQTTVWISQYLMAVGCVQVVLQLEMGAASVTVASIWMVVPLKQAQLSVVCAFLALLWPGMASARQLSVWDTTADQGVWSVQ